MTASQLRAVEISSPVSPTAAFEPIQRQSWQRWQLIVVIACAVGALFVLGATARGVGLSPDSMQYLAASESFARDSGLMSVGWEGDPTPLTHFPPAYPLLLATATRAGIPASEFARWVNVGLFVLTIVLATAIARRIAPAPSWAAPVVACLFAVAHDLVVTHSMAWTEPLYLTLTLAGLLALAGAIDRRSMPLLAVAAALAGLSAIVRYIGVTNVGLVPLAVVFWWPAAAWRRLRAASVVGLIAAAPLLAVLVLSAVSSDAPVANRQLLWHPLEIMDLRMAAAVVGKWVSPLSDANYLTAVWLVVFIMLLGVVIASRVRADGQRRTSTTETLSETHTLARVLVLYAALYMAVLVGSMLLADAQTLFDPRLLVPMLAVAIILGAVWLMRADALGRRVRFATWAILALVMIAEVSRLVPWMREAYGHGLALRRLDPSDRALVSATLGLPESARVYSNRPYFLRVQTARPVFGVPRMRDPNSLLPNQRHALQVQAICVGAAARQTYLVLFEHEIEDPTVNGQVAARAGDVVRMGGGEVIRVRPLCRAA